jgi:hypothetical protein
MAEFKMPKFVYKDKTIPLDKCYQELADMNYQSPIDVVYQGFQTKLEGDIFEAIQSYGVYVDKDELVKALKYDRDQYRKGFEDGCKGATDRIKAEVAREIFEEIERKITHDIDVNNACIVELDDSAELYHRVKGELFVLCDIQDFIAELKKKYTEEQE